MKKILITGANSFVGTSIERWLMRDSNNYKVSFDTCATNIINKLFERYATSNTLIITTNSEHPSVVYNLNKHNDDNIIYIDNMLSIFDIKNKIFYTKRVKQIRRIIYEN